MVKHNKTYRKNKTLFCCLAIAYYLSGCSSKDLVKPDPNDPWEGWNRGTQDFNDDLDKTIVKPLAEGYLKITPEAVDKSVTNFFSNLSDIGVTVNDFLQLKATQGCMDLARFVVNTTAGLVGIFDVAQELDLPKHHEDFGQTLGFWGVPTGPYWVLPFVGPSTPRETVGLIGDALLNPLTYTVLISGGAASVASLGTGVVDLADTRAGLLTTESIVQEAAVDRYEFIKSSYLQRRKYLLYDGNLPEDDSLDIDFENDLDGATSKPEDKNAASGPISETGETKQLPPVIDNSSKLPRTSDDSESHEAPVKQPHLEIYTPDNK
ncbi:MAG: ABC transporter [Methylobacter sp.]|nr:MAG: ABC transporter [Methylobacter sp.]PPD32031.1 MAG: ABC transporter [Methylomonas sp.]